MRLSISLRHEPYSPCADKYLEAGEYLEQLKAAIGSGKHGNRASMKAKADLEHLLAHDLCLLEKRVGVCKEALDALNEKADWEFVSSNGDMRMYQRWRAGNELGVKIEAVLGPDPPIRTADVRCLAGRVDHCDGAHYLLDRVTCVQRMCIYVRH